MIITLILAGWFFSGIIGTFIVINILQNNQELESIGHNVIQNIMYAIGMVLGPVVFLASLILAILYRKQKN